MGGRAITADPGKNSLYYHFGGLILSFPSINVILHSSRRSRVWNYSSWLAECVTLHLICNPFLLLSTKLNDICLMATWPSAYPTELVWGGAHAGGHMVGHRCSQRSECVYIKKTECECTSTEEVYALSQRIELLCCKRASKEEMCWSNCVCLR